MKAPQNPLIARIAAACRMQGQGRPAAAVGGAARPSRLGGLTPGRTGGTRVSRGAAGLNAGSRALCRLPDVVRGSTSKPERRQESVFSPPGCSADRRRPHGLNLPAGSHARPRSSTARQLRLGGTPPPKSRGPQPRHCKSNRCGGLAPGRHAGLRVVAVVVTRRAAWVAATQLLTEGLGLAAGSIRAVAAGGGLGLAHQHAAAAARLYR
jgi:hypothetical protein